MEKLDKYEGHLYNWYDLKTLAPLEPRFVSSVDEGNLAACLLTCAQALRREAWPMIEAGKVRPIIYREFAAADAAQAHALMESSQHTGKIVLTWEK